MPSFQSSLQTSLTILDVGTYIPVIDNVIIWLLSWWKKKYSYVVYFASLYESYGYWRIKTNQEINDIIKGQNIIGFIRKQSLNWLGHVERMTEDK